MADNEVYRLAEHNKPNGYGPYSSLGSARNAASQVWGWGWKYTNDIDKLDPSIQKLEPVFLFVEGGIGFQITMGWVKAE